MHVFICNELICMANGLTIFAMITVIIKANQNIPPLNENTILFLEGRIVLGQVGIITDTCGVVV